MSPRPKKNRHCSCPHIRPGADIIKPAGIPTHAIEKVPLPIDELEAMRLCDSEGLSQEKAGGLMGVSRGTVQRLVANGRKKVVEAIVNGQALVIVKEDDE